MYLFSSQNSFIVVLRSLLTAPRLSTARPVSRADLPVSRTERQVSVSSEPCLNPIDVRITLVARVSHAGTLGLTIDDLWIKVRLMAESASLRILRFVLVRSENNSSVEGAENGFPDVSYEIHTPSPAKSVRTLIASSSSIN